jgi:pantoate--beta-alanine ligase
MEIAERIEETRLRLGEIRRAGRPIALVPTMGAFHEGHLELMRWAKAGKGLEASGKPFVVVSIFVNPTQFGPNEDYASYPRDMESDCRKAKAVGVDLIFAPAVEEMYPSADLSAEVRPRRTKADSTIVEVGRLGEGMCGAHRPGHFRGVATVVCKLFNIIQPDAAYFGEKDYQQLKIIEQMVRDLHMPVKIVPIPTVREPDGLAMSSRNAYLSPEERRAAPILHRALLAAKSLAEKGERNPEALIEAVRRCVAKEPLLRLEYVELRDAQTLETLAILDRPAVLALASRLGKARLIDNIIICQ